MDFCSSTYSDITGIQCLTYIVSIVNVTLWYTRNILLWNKNDIKSTRMSNGDHLGLSFEWCSLFTIQNRDIKIYEVHCNLFLDPINVIHYKPTARDYRNLSNIAYFVFSNRGFLSIFLFGSFRQPLLLSNTCLSISLLYNTQQTPGIG